MNNKNELTILKQEGKLLVDSREIAKMIEKNHKELLRDIRTYESYLGESNFALSDFFIESTYQNSQNKTLPCYLLTKKGCDMVANKLIGAKGVLFTASYVTKFDEMEKELQLSQFKLPTTYKEALLMLVANEEEKEKLIEENNHKQELINGLVDDVDVYKKRSIINRVCKKTNKHDYADRYGELYKCFCETYHIDLPARCEGYNIKHPKLKDKQTVIGYADKFGHIDTLYQCCVKLYEADVKKTIDELNSVQ
jgi:Rha family phage regulatory protein